MIDQTLVFFGESVKALAGPGRVGGHLVVFGGPDQTDLSPARDYFLKSTNFWVDVAKGVTVPLLYHHGLNKEVGKRPLGSAHLKMDDVGIWAEAEIDKADAYAMKVAELVEAGKLRWSSGTASHLMDRERQPNGSHQIKSWHLGVEASLTPTAAEPRALAIPLKSLIEASPDDGLPVGQTLEDHSRTVLAAVAGFARRFETHPAVRGERPLSPARREELKSLHDQVGEIIALTEPRAAAADWLRERDKSAAIARRLKRMGVPV